LSSIAFATTRPRKVVPLPLHVELAAGAEQRHGDLPERLVAVAARVDHLAELADQLLGPVAEHRREARVAQEEAAVAGKGDADRGIGEQRLVFELRVARLAGVARPHRLQRGLDAAQRRGIVHEGREARWRNSSA
jgi:hypothetical protein